MAIYAISDLHLAFNDNSKSMELFGAKWKDYVEKIEKNWKETVKNSDTVLIAGDISWANNLEEAIEDFSFINCLPGQKIIIKGNHDYYFSTMNKVQEFLKKNNFNTIHILHNNSFVIEGLAICGTRGWGNIEDSDKKLDNHKIMLREVGRLKISYNTLSNEDKKKDILVMTHFPPFYHEFKEALKEIGAKKCIYGHLHGKSQEEGVTGNIDGIEYIMASSDYTGFKLLEI